MNANPYTAPPAPTLVELQQLFMARLTHFSAGDENGIESDASEFPQQIAEGRLPAHLGLGIYTHAYTARLIEALENDHPVLGSYLGDKLWQRMCRGYIAAYPSRHRSLRFFGAGLPHYLAHAQDFAEYPEIAEVAEFERRLLDSFDAADAPRATWQQLLDRPQEHWPSLHPHFHPSLKLHRTECNSVEIWSALKAERAPPKVSSADSIHWALWRDVERISRFTSLTASESASIQHCRHGGDFAGLCELLVDWHSLDAVPAVALGQLRRWCDEGWISHWA